MVHVLFKPGLENFLAASEFDRCNNAKLTSLQSLLFQILANNIILYCFAFSPMLSNIFISQLPKANPDKHMIRRNLCENIVTRESRGEEEKNKQIIKVRIDSKTMWSLFLRINI